MLQYCPPLTPPEIGEAVEHDALWQGLCPRKRKLDLERDQAHQRHSAMIGTGFNNATSSQFGDVMMEHCAVTTACERQSARLIGALQQGEQGIALADG